MTDDLKPCPFCGGQASIVGFDAPERWVVCATCGASADTRQSASGAAEKWNTRAPAVSETPSGWRSMDSAPNWEGFGRALLKDWPTGDIDGSHLFDMSLKYGLISEIPGGYNPDEHIDAEGICPERGDPWYEYAFSPSSDTQDAKRPKPHPDFCEECGRDKNHRCTCEPVQFYRPPSQDAVREAARVEKSLRQLVKEADACGRNINAAWVPLFDEARAALRAIEGER